MTSTTDIINAIDSGLCDDDLRQIYQAVIERTQAVAKREARKVKIGDTVRLTNIRPLYMNGIIAKVTGRTAQRFTIVLERPQGRFRAGVNIKVPITAVEKVA